MITVIVQARMSSSRLPGKVLMPAQGKPLLEYLLKRLSRSQKIGEVIVVTSDHSSDDPIADYCSQNRVSFERGSLENVAHRFLQTIERRNLRSFVRISADSPMMDPRLVDEAAVFFQTHDYEIVTNTYRRTFPKGQSIEVVSADCFKKAFGNFSQQDETEHVTPYFYKHPEEFRIHNFTAPGGDYHTRNLCVDTREDYERFLGMLALTDSPYSLGWRECLQLQAKLTNTEGV